MKKILFLLFLLLLNTAAAQDYIPMLQEDNVWSVDFEPWGFPNGSVQFTIGSIVTIDGVDYKELIRIPSQSVSCLLREEGPLIYRYDNYNNEEFLFYDFSLEVGDTIQLYSDVFPTCIGYGSFIYIAEVANVETMFIAGENRKVIEFNQSGSSLIVETWIEGIGSLSGIDSFGQNYDNAIHLMCFTKDGTTTYFNEYTVCSTLDVEEFNQSEIRLVPNPVNNLSILQFPAEAAVDRLTIFNFSGKLIRDEAVTNEYVTINHMDYASGLYFYQVFSENKLLKTEKFIVK